MSTMIFKEKDILTICELDAELILKSFSVSDSLGITAIKSTISGFKSEICSYKGKIVPALDLDYRFYIVNLLNISVKDADEVLKAKIFSEIVIPS